MTEARLVEIESRLAFQDDLIQTMSAELAAQQERVRAVEIQLDELRRQFRGLAQQYPGQDLDEPPPPHY